MLNAVAAYLLANWHLRRMPRETASERRVRLAWCRDHCATFGGRWMVIAIAALFLHLSPLGYLFVVARLPLLLIVFLAAFALGMAHLVAQIVCQSRVGPPRVDPPSDWTDDDRE